MAQKTEERPLWPRAPVSEDPRELRNWAQALTKQLTQVFQQMGYRANTTVPKDGSEEANINILPDSSIIADKLTQGAQSFSTDIDFSATDQNTVAWTAGTITFADGSSHSINGGDTGDMAAATFIYLDTDVSETELQTSTTFSDVVGDNKKLLCYAQVAPTANQNAFFLPAIGSFNANTDQLSVDRLSALTADMGELTAGVVRDANSRFVLDLDSVLQTIADNQGTPIDRVKIGQLGGGNADYGIEVYDANGDIILSATGLGVEVVDTAQLVDQAVNDISVQREAGIHSLDFSNSFDSVVIGNSIDDLEPLPPGQRRFYEYNFFMEASYNYTNSSGIAEISTAIRFRGFDDQDNEIAESTETFFGLFVDPGEDVDSERRRISGMIDHQFAPWNDSSLSYITIEAFSVGNADVVGFIEISDFLVRTQRVKK